MKTEDHEVFGALIALIRGCEYKQKKGQTMTFGDIIKALVVGGFAGILPDIIEPATNPNHRGFFHSVAMLKILAYARARTWQAQNLTEEQKQQISTLIDAYTSHLLSDSATQKGLPFLF